MRPGRRPGCDGLPLPHLQQPDLEALRTEPMKQAKSIIGLLSASLLAQMLAVACRAPPGIDPPEGNCTLSAEPLRQELMRDGGTLCAPRSDWATARRLEPNSDGGQCTCL